MFYSLLHTHTCATKATNSIPIMYNIEHYESETTKTSPKRTLANSQSDNDVSVRSNNEDPYYVG